MGWLTGEITASRISWIIVGIAQFLVGAAFAYCVTLIAKSTTIDNSCK